MIGFGFWSSSGAYNSYGIYDRVFGLVSSSLRKRQLRVVLDGKSKQEYPVNVGVSQGSIFDPAFFLLYINDVPDDVICSSAICAVNMSSFAQFGITRAILKR